MKAKPCKHLDYDEDSYSPGCSLKSVPSRPEIRYWHRNVVPYEEAPRKVQFCKLYGRINSIFDCYADEIESGRHCWEQK